MKRRMSILAGVSLMATSLVAAGTGFAQEYKFVHASLNPATHVDYPVNMDFVRRVEELSNGRITFEVFDGGVLGDEREMIEQIATGTITTARLTPASLSAICPEISILNLPFLFEDAKSMLEVVHSDEFASLCDETLVADGVRPLDYWWMGVRDVYSKMPIESLEDVKGLKVRTWQDQYVIESWKQLGAIPTPISFSELYTSLQTGTVDGAEGWASSYNAQSFYEVAPHLSRIAYIQIASTLVISEAIWQSLPEDLQDVVRRAAEENAQFAQDTFTKLQNDIYVRAEENGTVHEVSDLRKWKEVTLPVFEKFAEENPGPAGDLLRSLTAD